MGQKTNPIGLRTAVTKDWASKWYSDKKGFAAYMAEDRAIRDLLYSKLENAAVTKILTARPCVVIGRRGAEIDVIKEELSRMTNKEVYVDIQEIRQPETDAQLVAENVKMQLERRIAYRRAMKRAVQTAMDFGAEGIRIRCAGRLGGSEIARVEQYLEGRVPLHTLRATIDYGFTEAKTKAGLLGIKCWICKGEDSPSKSGEEEVIETGAPKGKQ